MSVVESSTLTGTLTGAERWRLTRVVVLQSVEHDTPVPAPTEVNDDAELFPTLDDDGLLRYRGRWVAVPEAQLPLVRLLLDRFQTTVSDAELLEVFPAGPGAGAKRRLAGALHRLRSRVSECGLTLCRVRARGYILDHLAAAGGDVRLPSEEAVAPSGCGANLSVE
jgi:hypothetical protein